MVEKSKLDEDREGKAVDPSHYCDADHAGCQDTRRSTSGNVQFLGERLISWSSKRQKSAAISRTEAEYIALSGCYCNSVFILKASIPSKRKLDLTTGINFLGYGLLNDHTKAFLVTADVLAIYMQEFLATAYVHQHSIRFKMDSKKNIIDLEAFREMLHISPRVPGQSFDELPFEEEILDFLRFLGHSAQIKTLTDKPSIPRRNKVNWHYVRDDILFSTIKVVSRHQNPQQYGAILPIELTTKDIRNTKAYKEYYACATRVATPKPKVSAIRKRGGSDSSTTPPTAVASPRPITIVTAAPRLTTAAKGKQPAIATSPYDPSKVERTEAEQLKIILRKSRQETYISQHGGSSTDEGTSSKPGVSDVPSDDSEEKISWNSSDDEDVDAQDKRRDDDEGKKNDEKIAKLYEQEDIESGEGDAKETKSDGESEEEETREEEEEIFDLIPRTLEDSEDDGNGEEDHRLRVSKEQRLIEEEEADELYRDVDINQGQGLQVSQDIEDSHVTLTPVKPDGQQKSSSVSSFVTSMLNPISDAGVESIFTTASSPIAPLQTPTPIMTPSTIATITTSKRVKSLEANFLEFMQTNQFAEAVSNIPGIVHQYMNQQMTEAVRKAVQIQTDRLQYSFQRENDEFLRTIDENMNKIIKGQVKSQVKEQVSRILPRIEESVNAQLEAKVLTRSSHSSRTSYAVAADLTKMELKKILIEKMEGNKSIQRSDEQRNLYKALVDTYEADKTILESYGDTSILKRRRGDDDQEGPSAGLDRGSKRRREGGEPKSASTPSEPATRSARKSKTRTQSRHMSASESAFAEEPVQTTYQMDEPLHPVFEKGAEDQPIVQTSQHPEWFSQPRKPPTPDRDWNKTLPAIQGSAQTWISELAKQADSRSSNFIMNRLGVDTLTPELLAGPTYELMRGSCISLTELEYHLEEDVYKEYRHPAACGRSSTGSRKLPEEAQLTMPDTYRSDLKRRETYTAYSNPRGFIYQNKDKKNRLMRIDELHKFSDGTLNDVRNALDDRLKRIRMKYLPQTIWRKGDQDRAAAMIQSIDKMLKTRRIMRSLKRSILTDLQETLKRMWRYLVLAELHIHNHMLIPDYQDNKYQDFRYSDDLSKSRKLELRLVFVFSLFFVGNKMQKAFLPPGESSHWQYKFPLPVKDVPTARRLEIPLPGVCTAIEEMMKKLSVKDRWQLH
nr:retrovirus-related Pol polyprotein from transposon TNT 1-94 [Tanacetum cinerariifolium]